MDRGVRDGSGGPGNSRREDRFGQSRREFLRALSATLGVALASDPSRAFGEIRDIGAALPKVRSFSLTR